MTDRRQFIKTLAGVPPLLALQPAFAAPDPTRVALIIGNAAYKQAPLENPTNDAAAMRDLFTTAGFTTDSLLNAKRTDLLAAIDRFTTLVQKSETKQALFYYAGHGAQLDWRNYLLPVDIAVRAPEDVKNQCVDLGIILGRLSKLKDKTFIIILDACRDDPFKGAYRPEQKGLSQFDAPVGSLLAYATSPGNVAADGSGKNGLYTENLVRELSNRSAKIEDALKRVRLSVRLGSNGDQIPWETTSLESDVFIFPEGQKKLSEADMEKLLEAEMEAWSRVKSSRKADDWIAYLKDYPNGRFAEIAQNRLTRLLGEARNTPVATAAPASTTSSQPSTAPKPPQAPLLILKPGGDMSFQVQASANPNSAGQFPLGRKYSVGDEATMQLSDLLTGIVGKTQSLRVTKVDEDNDRVELNDGAYIWDIMGNRITDPESGSSDTARQFVPAELYVGRKWTAAWKQDHPRAGKRRVEINLRIGAFETIDVPAGKFQAFRVDSDGWANDNFGSASFEGRIWIVPGLNFPIRGESLVRRGNRLIQTDRLELVRLSQAHIASNCLMDRSNTRSLVIRSSCGG
jgi:uncharacterized caspase-like protein